MNRNKCKPTLLDRDTLLSEDLDFMTRDKIMDECKECTSKDICLCIQGILDKPKQTTQDYQAIDQCLEEIYYPTK